ncbi:VanZ family protein [Salinibacterium sp. CAN_S4]|uniref:VanZ family protein n=1 Tax=Salinibacterium sp. CAN_S4 TaxID=2787727 RepID=UPI0018EF4D22
MDDRPARSRRWLAAGLILYAVAALVVLLAPVSYGDVIASIRDLMGDSYRTLFGSGWIEFSANIVLFVPLGVLLTLQFRRPAVGVIASILVSVGVELAQLVIPFRQATVRDVIANMIGAVIGAMVVWLIRHWRVSHRRASRVARQSGRP